MNSINNNNNVRNSWLIITKIPLKNIKFYIYNLIYSSIHSTLFEKDLRTLNTHSWICCVLMPPECVLQAFLWAAVIDDCFMSVQHCRCHLPAAAFWLWTSWLIRVKQSAVEAAVTLAGDLFSSKKLPLYAF